MVANQTEAIRKTSSSPLPEKPAKKTSVREIATTALIALSLLLPSCVGVANASTAEPQKSQPPTTLDFGSYSSSPDLTVGTRQDGFGRGDLNISEAEAADAQKTALSFQKFNPYALGGENFVTKWERIENNNGERSTVLYVVGGQNANYLNHNVENKTAAVVAGGRIFHFPFAQLGTEFSAEEAVMRVDSDGTPRIYGNNDNGGAKVLAEAQKNSSGSFYWSFNK